MNHCANAVFAAISTPLARPRNKKAQQPYCHGCSTQPTSATAPQKNGVKSNVDLREQRPVELRGKRKGTTNIAGALVNHESRRRPALRNPGNFQQSKTLQHNHRLIQEFKISPSERPCSFKLSPPPSSKRLQNAPAVAMCPVIR